jgi:hypothetical protein
MWNYHGGENIDWGLLGHDTVQSNSLHGAASFVRS